MQVQSHLQVSEHHKNLENTLSVCVDTHMLRDTTIYSENVTKGLFTLL